LPLPDPLSAQKALNGPAVSTSVCFPSFVSGDLATLRLGAARAVALARVIIIRATLSCVETGLHDAAFAEGQRSDLSALWSDSMSKPSLSPSCFLTAPSIEAVAASPSLQRSAEHRTKSPQERARHHCLSDHKPFSANAAIPSGSNKDWIPQGASEKASTSSNSPSYRIASRA
jgi:hypothetical protein